MQSLDARLTALEAQQQAKPKPGGAAHIHAWCVEHGFDVVPPASLDMPSADYVKLVPTPALKALLEAHQGHNQPRAAMRPASPP